MKTVENGRRSSRTPRSGSRESGRQTRQEILRAAKHVLATHGHARFTLRRVAKEADLTVGNLAYHYRSKRELIRALIALLIADYRREEEMRLRGAPRRSSRAFGALLAWLMQDSVSPETSRLFRELWTMALHDTFIAKAIDGFYTEVNETVTEVVRQHFPNLRPSAAREIVQLIGIISEGSNVMYATARKPTAPFQRVCRLACSLLVRAAQNAARTPKRSDRFRPRAGMALERAGA
ncbi:MAG TPA: TetR/AcrR family transcriptional regulator [Steroidobacteraceae bacterium]|jgi:AcrR family transcriptional regulator|nr:TetR/AcrR family transcriptional regulator [Steroidobacteraceae bacterium]